MKKIICCLFLILLFSTTFSYANTTLYQQETESKISSGTTLKNYRLLTEDGWLDINVLEINLKDKYTKIGLLTSSEGVGKLQNVLTMAKNANAIAAINGDFFAGNAGKGHSIGLSIRDSAIISSAAKENTEKDTFSTFALDEKNNVFFDYFTSTISFTSQRTKKEIEIASINKYADDYSQPVIFTSDWGDFSLGSLEGLSLTELVIENNKVIEIRQNEPAVEIPKDGFVISVLKDSESGIFLTENFKKGTKIDLSVTLSPEIEKIEFAISGGAKLLDDGEIPEDFSHNISGRNPRTALGTSEDGETLYLITVDGRQESSIGMTQTELAEFLKTINIYNAINLDGGGSTTMVAQNLGESNLITINQPSGGSLRSVINAIGVFSTAPNSEKVYGLNIQVEDTNIFQGEEREIKVTAYNKYYNPVEIDSEDIQWDYNGVALTVKDGKISGNTVGSSILTASIGKVEAEIEINILSPVNELVILPKQKMISPNESVSYTIQAKNKNGYYAKTDFSTISANLIAFYQDGKKQETIPSDATFNPETFTFTAKTSGEYLLAFSKGDITSYAQVSVASQKAVVLDEFETETFRFDEYPDEVIGDASLSKEQSYSGETSVKLEYDFKQDIQIRGAYIELKEVYTIPENATSLSFWVYNDSYKDEKLKIKLKDSSGNVKLIVLQDNLSHTGWKEINYDLSSISLPATLSDIYLAQDDLSVQESGYIYVDHLIYYTNQTSEDLKIRLPNDSKLEDANNFPIQTEETFKIALLDTIHEPELMIESLRNTNLIHSINKNADLTIFTEDISEEQTKEITTEIFTRKNYDLYELKNTTLISLDISNHSIRKTDANQWIHLQYDIKDSEKENILILLNGSIDDFTDYEERKLFVDLLCELKRETKKNIIVLHTGYTTDYSMERGVKFLGINTYHIPAENIAKDFSYLLISITGNNISYEVKNIFE